MRQRPTIREHVHVRQYESHLDCRCARQPAVEPNDVWAMDFVQDQLATRKKIHVLNVVHTFLPYVSLLDPRFNVSRAQLEISRLKPSDQHVCHLVALSPNHHHMLNSRNWTR